MRVLYISPYYYPSVAGIERFCEGIATRISKLGHEVHVITKAVEGLRQTEEIQGVIIHRIKPTFQYSKALVTPHIKQKIREIGPDIIHIQGPAPGMENFLPRDANHRTIMTCHTDLSLDSSIVYRFASAVYRKVEFPRVISKLDKVVITSEAFKSHSKFWKLFSQISQDKISIIPMATDTELFSPGIKTKTQYKKELNIHSKFFGTFVASMELRHNYKGVEFLLDAISQLRDIDITFSLIGEGQLKQKYIEIAYSLGISDRVWFPGHVEDEALVKHYRAADFFVLPSISPAEAQGIVSIEAMACGTPVITSRIYGPMELINEGYNGYLVKPRDSKNLAMVIKKILSDENILKKMQVNARHEAIEKYSWNKIVDRYLRECYLNGQ